jgi:hypothetical protein
MVLVRMANGTILSSYLLPLPFTASCAPAFLSNQTPPLVTCLNNPSIVGLQDSNGAVQQIVHLPGGVEMYDVAGRPSGAVSITRWAVRDSNHVQIVDVALSDRGRVAETSTMTVTIPQQYRIATSSFGPSIYAGAVGRASDGTLGMAFVDARSGCLITMEVSAAGQLRWVSEDAHLCSNSGPYFDGIEFSNEHMFLAVNGLFFHAVLSYAGSHLLWSHTLHDKAQTSFGWPDQFTLSKAGSPILAGIGHGSLFHEAPNANPSVYGLFIVKFVASSGATTSTAMIRSQLVYRRAYSLLSPIGIAATRDGTNVAERPWTNKWPATAASVPFAVLVEPTTT